MSTDLTTIPAAALARLRDKARLAATVETWKPAPGDVLEGVIAGSRLATGPFGEQRQMLVQGIDGATVAVWLSGWLVSQLKAQGAELGDLVSIAFHGKEFGKSGKPFNRITLVVEHAQRAAS